MTKTSVTEQLVESAIRAVPEGDDIAEALGRQFGEMTCREMLPILRRIIARMERAASEDIFLTRTISIKTQHGALRRKASVLEFIAVHRDLQIPKSFAITHVPTGMKITCIDDRDAAINAATLIVIRSQQAHIDLSFTIPGNVPTATSKAFCRIVLDVLDPLMQRKRARQQLG